MNAATDRDLQRLFAAYAPKLDDDPFLARTRIALLRQARLRRLRSVAGYAVVLLLVLLLAAKTAGPLGTFYASVEQCLASLSGRLSPVASQAWVYGATAAVLILGRRRIRAFLAPW